MMAAVPAMTVWPILQQRENTRRESGPQLVPTPTSEAVLVESAKLGDQDAFAELIRRNYQFCLSKAYMILRNRGDAEDEVQNACARAWTHLWQFQSNGSFGGWLGRIVSNQCLMLLRERRGARMVSVDELFDADGAFRLEVIDQQPLPEEAVGDGQVCSVLLREINCIPRLLREAFAMRYLHQSAMRDIAAHLGISVPAAKSRLMRARTELKQRLAKHQGQAGCSTLFGKPRRGRVAYVRAN